jgi:hypothetical protein
MKNRLPVALLAYLVIAGCLSPRPWWERELNAWVGADAQELESVWGPPTRTIIGDSGRPVLVYESHSQIDPRQDTLRDQVVDTRYDGAGCKVIPRPGVSPRS